ncbi:uncharacterized protein B0H18DRAFT_1042673 [Fomitopsis serialis]|uniref:uncharacterized protein n=1 Tax=Fomitopsis serialis TaxID=139415 RepID=UPI002007D6B7|nr:uncharacterized protein B0H18DRAFT_1042673 [Neoantrodia serialis]KAH9915128.1 hypothetical protein B0H18DRAFT_1042673 [Neoantrodia serialis]
MMLLLARDVLRVPSASPAHGDGSPATAPPHDNVAVAIIDEPTFVGKSSVLLSYLRQRLSAPPASTPASFPPDVPLTSSSSAPPPRPQLTFLVGTDTLERLFAPRYYPSPSAMASALHRFLSAHPAGDDARVVCARRALLSPEAQGEEAKLRAAIREFAEEGRVLLVDIPEELRSVSSTLIRQGANGGHEQWREMVTPAVAEYIETHRLYHV